MFIYKEEARNRNLNSLAKKKCRVSGVCRPKKTTQKKKIKFAKNK